MLDRYRFFFLFFLLKLVSLVFFCQDLSMNQQREAEKMKKSDPVKAKQMERLGMGFGGTYFLHT